MTAFFGTAKSRVTSNQPTLKRFVWKSMKFSSQKPSENFVVLDFQQVDITTSEGRESNQDKFNFITTKLIFLEISSTAATLARFD